MNKIFYQLKRIFFSGNKTSFSINNNSTTINIASSIIRKLHDNYTDFDLIKTEYDDSILIDGVKSGKVFSIFLNKSKTFIDEITIVSHGEFDIDALVNHILNVFDIQNNKNLEDEPLFENEKRYIDVSYMRECFDGLYHNIYTLTTLRKGREICL